jgi:aerobic carbon-monoxide dehydrogenase medium subunit
MKPASFSYLRPTSLEEALEQLAHTDGAKVIAGGQSLGPMLNMRVAAPSALVDINDMTELAYVRDLGDVMEVGALTRHDQVANSETVRRCCPLLAQAAATIGHYAIRQRGTLGGSLAHADPAAQLALIAVTLDAQINVMSVRGQRTLPAADFFAGVMTTALEPDEMISSVRFPKMVPQEGTAFLHFNRRHGDFAIVAVATTVTLRGGHAEALRIGISGTAPTPLSLTLMAGQFAGRVPNEVWIDQLAAATQEEIAPEDDDRIPAAYRKELAATLVRRTMQRALARAQEGLT